VLLRARVGVSTEAVIELGKFTSESVEYVIHDAREFALESERNLISDNDRIIDIVFKKSCDSIGDEFAKSWNLIDQLFDKVSYVGYSKIRLTQYFSLSPLESTKGDVFELVVPQHMRGKQQEPIKLNDLKSISITKKNKNAYRLLQIALNSNSVLERYIALFSALEWLAEKASKEKIINTCEKCGHQKNTGRTATGNYLASLFESYGISKKEIVQYKVLRHKIAHGTGTRDWSFVERVMNYSSYLEEILIQELDKRESVDGFNGSNVISSSIPYYVHTCMHDIDDSYVLLNSSWTAPIKFTQIKSRKNSGSISFGAPLGPNQVPVISPISWPNFQNS
jgi:hypothetical protein